LSIQHVQYWEVRLYGRGKKVARLYAARGSGRLLRCVMTGQVRGCGAWSEKEE